MLNHITVWMDEKDLNKRMRKTIEEQHKEFGDLSQIERSISSRLEHSTHLRKT